MRAVCVAHTLVRGYASAYPGGAPTFLRTGSTGGASGGVNVKYLGAAHQMFRAVAHFVPSGSEATTCAKHGSRTLPPPLSQ
eukprot:5603161-Prymnesium_polylepis.1